MNRQEATRLRAEARACELGYGSVEECIRHKMGSGITITTLCLQLDVSYQWMKNEMAKLGVVGQHHSREKRFWLPQKREDLFK